MDRNHLDCPLCGTQIRNDEIDVFMHILEWHPYLLYKDGKRVDGVWEHLLLVARGEVPLDSKLSKYVIRSAADHTRHAALLARTKANVVLNTSIADYKSPSSNITYGTRKKRKP